MRQLTPVEKLICDLHNMSLDWIESDAIGVNDDDASKCNRLDDDWQRVCNDNNLNINFREAWDIYVSLNMNF